jgi:hypothetical protein
MFFAVEWSRDISLDGDEGIKAFLSNNSYKCLNLDWGMVKVVGRDFREDMGEERARKLVEIAEDKLVKRYEVDRGNLPHWFKARDTGGGNLDFFIVYPSRNFMGVFSERAFYDANRLARIYEKRGESEFTLQKRYRD